MFKNKIKINMVMSVVLLVSMTIIACNMDKVATVEMEKENKNVKTKNGKVVVRLCRLFFFCINFFVQMILKY